MARRPCSECDELLPEGASPVQKTHNAACRAKRSRRIKRQKVDAGRKGGNPNTPEQQALAVAAASTKEVTHQVMADELRPIVREAITEDVLKAVKDLVGLTPAMVAAIENDILHGEPEIRQRAYTLLAKYTLGNPSVMPKSAEAQPAPMQVVFNMPRPGDSTSRDDSPEELVEATVVETQECSECGKAKPLQDFVSASTRCQGCHDELQARVAARFS